MSEQEQKDRREGAGEPGARPRRGSRRPIRGVLVAIDAPAVAERPWVVDAIDLSSAGMGLVLPPELPEGTAVELSFQLGDADFARLPAIVTHRLGSSGGVHFGEWPAAERCQLLEELVLLYEAED